MKKNLYLFEDAQPGLVLGEAPDEAGFIGRASTERGGRPAWRPRMAFLVRSAEGVLLGAFVSLSEFEVIALSSLNR